MKSNLHPSKPETAIILAAGRGTRLAPLTDHRHKCLLPLAGQSFIERSIRSFQKVGVHSFRIVTGHFRDQVEGFVRDTFPSLDVTFCPNDYFETTNTGYSLWVGLRGKAEAFYMADGDVLFELPLLEALANHPHPDVMVVDDDPTKLNEEAVKVQTNAQHHITKLGKNIPLSEAAGEFIGLARFSKAWAEYYLDACERIMAQRTSDNHYYEDVISTLVGRHSPIACLLTGKAIWAEVDTVEDYEAIQKAWPPV